MKTVGLTPGHHAYDSGAVANSLQENMLTIETMGYAISCLAKSGIYVVSPAGALSRKIQELNRHVLDCAVEIHFNAANAKAFGVEAIHHPGSVGGKKLANCIYSRLVSLSFLKERRVLDTDELGRSLAFTREVTAPSVIIEPLWLTNPEEAAIAKNSGNLFEIGQMIAKGIIDFLGA